MGRAVECPLCHGVDVAYEEVQYQADIFSRFPALTMQTMVALVCRNCRHVRLITPSKNWLREQVQN